MEDRRQTLLRLVAVATGTHDGGDNERANAANLVCQLIKEHPELISGRTSPISGPTTSPIKRGSSVVHPNAVAERDWRRLVKEKGLWEDTVVDESACASCGETVEQGDRAVGLRGSDLVTHNQCRDWWKGFEPEDVPF